MNRRTEWLIACVALVCAVAAVVLAARAVAPAKAAGLEGSFTPEEQMPVESLTEAVAEVEPKMPEPVATGSPEPMMAEPSHTEEELEILAIVIYGEAGGDACSDDTRLKVGNVFLNRVTSDRYPNTFYEVATQKQQYGRLYWTGIKWPDRASNPGEARAVERAYAIAERLLSGERVLPDDVIFQAEFPQGVETVCEQDGFYFCR